MAQGSLGESLEERKLLIAVVGLLFAALCFIWIKSYSPGLTASLTPQEFESPQQLSSNSPTTAQTPPLPDAVFPVNINTADASGLQQLPGIGPVLAQRIIAYREQAGGFKDASELIKVKGIGPKIMARLADKVILQ